MAVTAKELREKRAPIGKRIRELADKVNDEKREFTGEELTSWTESNAEYDRLSRQIEIAERSESIERESNGSTEDRGIGRENRNGRKERGRERRGEDRTAVPTSEDRALAMQAWFMRNSGKKISQAHRAACERVGVNLRSREFVINLRKGPGPANVQEARALSAVSGPAGGDTVPDGFMSRLEVALLQFGGVLQVADVFRTESGVPIPWPTMNDTSNEGEMLSENTTAGESDPVTGSVLFSAYKFSSKFIKVPVELYEDSAFLLANLIADTVGERLARAKNRKATLGHGASEPTGVVPSSKLGLTAAGQAAIAADEILKLERAIDPAYRVPGQAGYMAHDQTMLAIRLLKDGEGRYIWQQGLLAGEPDRLNGWPVVVNQHMDTPAAGKKTLLFGNWKKFKVREVGQIRLRRLVERFADADQEGFIAFQRMDSNLLDAGTGPIAHLIQAP